MTTPVFTNDAIVFGILMVSLGFVFYTENLKSGFWPKFYKIVPGLFMAYFIPALFTTFRVISPEWESKNTEGEIIKKQFTIILCCKSFFIASCFGFNDIKYRFKSDI